MAKLIICIDGLGKDLVTKENMPFLYDFGKRNYFGTLETLFAFTGLEYCFFTGKNPEKSRIWLEFCKVDKSIFGNSLLKIFYFNKNLRNYLGALLQLFGKRTYLAGTHNIPKNKLKDFDVSTKDGLWKLGFFQDKSFAFYKWPFFVTKEGKENKEIIFKYENDDERMTRLLESKDKDLYYTQLMLVDKALHKFGKKNLETKNALRKLDGWLKKHLTEFIKNNKNADIFIWSDHGFSDIKNYIDIGSILPKKKGYNFFIAGTTVSFWFENNNIREEITKIVGKDSRIKILTEKSAKKYKIPLDKRNGDLIIFLEKGDYFFPNFYQKNSNERFIGMHGYPDDKELNGIFISNKKIPKKLKMEEAWGYIK